jgi:acetyl-CoA carboxylase biotin carboxyl carrier protein
MGPSPKKHKHIQEEITMDTKTIRELITIVEQSAITSFEIEEGGCRIQIRKSPDGGAPIAQRAPQEAHYTTPSVPPQLQYQAAPGSIPGAAPDAAEERDAVPQITGEGILSPMLGVFYASPSPDSEPFVKLGDRVKKGDVLCIIEAMKLMNEITAERDGEIVQILPKNGQIVEFEQVLFRIQ